MLKWKGVPVMCKNQNDIDTRIHRKCLIARTTESEMLELGGKCLGIFKDACRQTTLKANEVVNDLCSHVTENDDVFRTDENMSGALADLLLFSSEGRAEKYDMKITEMLQTVTLIRLMEDLRMLVYSFPEYGPEFVKILSLCYMNTFDYTEDDILYTLNIGRSTYYKKKRRAIILFGLAIREYLAKGQSQGMDYTYHSEGVQLRFECNR